MNGTITRLRCLVTGHDKSHDYYTPDNWECERCGKEKEVATELRVD